MAMYSGKVDETKKLLSTRLWGVTSKKMAPQKVNPNPMKLNICDPEKIDIANRAIPEIKNEMAIKSKSRFGFLGFFCISVLRRLNLFIALSKIFFVCSGI
jgi:hypothetical protein